MSLLFQSLTASVESPGMSNCAGSFHDYEVQLFCEIQLRNAYQLIQMKEYLDAWCILDEFPPEQKCKPEVVSLLDLLRRETGCVEYARCVGV